MAYYRLYFIRAGHIEAFDVIDADDDAKAIEAAGRASWKGPMELWCGDRKVQSFNERSDSET